jgi:hypothetical protein
MEAARIVLRANTKVMAFVWAVQMGKYTIVLYKDVYAMKLPTTIGT